MNNDFLKHWEPEEVAAPGSDGWTTARVSSLCLECAKLDPQTLVCEVRGFQMDMAPPVYACLEYSEAKKEPDAEQVEIHRTFTVEVTQILKVGRSEAKAAELNVRGKSEEDLERAVAASLGAESVKVRDLKVWVLDR